MERGYVRELDLSNCGPASVATRVGVVPGLRSSAGKPGFFSFFFFHLFSFSTRRPDVVFFFPRSTTAANAVVLLRAVNANPHQPDTARLYPSNSKVDALQA